MQENFHHTMIISEEAKKFMIFHSVAPTPSHYAVAYYYFTKENLSLNSKIDVQLAAEKPLDTISLILCLLNFYQRLNKLKIKYSHL